MVPTRWHAGLDPRVVPAIVRQIPPSAVLHAHDAHAVTLAGLSAWLTKSPLVATRRVIFPLRSRFFWRRACRIIVISSAVRDALIRDGLERTRLVVIPSAVDPAATESPGVDLRTRLSIPQNGHLAVTLGALTPEKDHSTLIRAARRLVQDLPDLHWAIVGSGPLKHELEQQIAQAGLTSRVHLLGQLNNAHEALSGANVFVLSSLSEGLGSSILAAMARGIPVVATRVGGVPEVLGNGGGLLVQPGDPAELAAAVHRVLSDAELGPRLIDKARQEVERFSLGGMAEHVLSVYRSCSFS